jgi:hypothetical protein
MAVPGLKRKAASPCTVSWDSMSGDARSRHCALCQLPVFNLAGLTQSEVDALLSQKTDGACDSYYQRPDGTAMASDCPVGLLGVPARPSWRKWKVAAAMMGTLFVVSAEGWSVFGDNIRKLFGASVVCHLRMNDQPQARAPHHGDVDFAYQRSTRPHRDPFAEPAPEVRRDPFAAPELPR